MVTPKITVENLSHAFDIVSGLFAPLAGRPAVTKRTPTFEEIVDTRYAPTKFP